MARGPGTNGEKSTEIGAKGNSESIGTTIETEKGEGEKRASLEPVSNEVVTGTEKIQDGDHSAPQKSEDDYDKSKGSGSTPHILATTQGVERSAEETDSTQYLPTSEHIDEVVKQPQTGEAERRASESQCDEQRSQTQTAETQQRPELRQKPTKESRSQAYLDTGVSSGMHEESNSDEALTMTERCAKDVFEQFVDEIAEDLSFEVPQCQSHHFSMSV